MQKKLCPICHREVYWLVHHLHNVTDQFALEEVKNDFMGWTEDDGLCLPCLERYRAHNSMRCFDIKVTMN